mgnify:CR=1 FL=1
MPVMKKDLHVIGEEYVEVRAIESLTDLLLSLTLWKEGYTRNSAGKAFNAVKALISALVVTNEDKLVSLLRTKRRKSGLKRRPI